MANAQAQDPHAQFTADVAAVSATNFCSLWPAGKQVLQTLAATISNPFVKIAITTVIGAGDALCGVKSSVAAVAAPTQDAVKAQLQAAGINSVDDLAREITNRQPVEMSANTWLIHNGYFFSPNK